MYLSIIIAGLILILTIYWLAKWRLTSAALYGDLGQPPGPRGLPWLGNALDLDLSAVHISLANLAKKYGPVMYIRLFHMTVVVLSGIDVIQEALVKKGADYAGRPNLYRSWFCTKQGHDIIFQDYTPQVQKLRKVVHRSLKLYTSTVKHDIQDKIGQEIETIIEIFSRTNGQNYYAFPTLYKGACNMICTVLFGERYQYDDPDLGTVKSIDTIYNAELGPSKGAELDLFPWLRYLGHPTYRQMVKANKIRDIFFKEKLEKQRDLFTNGTCSGIIGELMKQQEEDTATTGDSLITDDSMKMVMGDLLVAGSDTTATVLYCCLVYLMQNQQAQDRAFNAIDSIIGNVRQPSLEDRSDLGYIDACLLETMRLISQTPLSIPHSATVDSTLAGYHIPKGCQVWINLWALNHDSFWKDPFEFKPERLLMSNGQVTTVDSEICRRLLPFGAGRRVCVGESLARVELFLYLTSLLQKFKFLPPQGQPNAKLDPRTFLPGVILHPKPIEMQILPR